MLHIKDMREVYEAMGLGDPPIARFDRGEDVWDGSQLGTVGLDECDIQFDPTRRVFQYLVHWVGGGFDIMDEKHLISFEDKDELESLQVQHEALLVAAEEAKHAMELAVSNPPVGRLECESALQILDRVLGVGKKKRAA